MIAALAAALTYSPPWFLVSLGALSLLSAAYILVILFPED